VREVHSVTGADLDHPPAQPGERAIAFSAVPRCPDSALIRSYIRANRGC
jgi:hypothetical protein